MSEIENEDLGEISSSFEGYTKNPYPLDGTWIQLLGDYKRERIQFDQSVYGGKGGWFNERNHAVKAPQPGRSWKLV